MFSRYINMSGASLFRRYNYNSSLTRECVKLSSHYHSHHLQHCCRLHGKFKWCKQKMSIWLCEQGIQVFRACTRQFEFIAAQRIRRSIQIFHLYTRIWGEVALNDLIKSLRHRIVRNNSNNNNFLAGAVGFAIYNWDKERISDDEISSYNLEIERLHKLKDSTVICSKCHLRLIIDVNQAGVQYCQCYDVKHAAKKAHEEEVEWEPFIERQDMLVWRREEKNVKGLYSYKVYGSFDDVSAEDFLQVQIDIDYRKEWDATAKQLEVIDTDPMFNDSKNSRSDVIYWEMIWPRMFANRDYVYQRRWFYNEETGVVIIVSKGTDHPNAPVRSDTYRVTTYWSYMVIKPHTNFHEPGIEFVLTYFDDPGVNIPSAVTAWVAISGLPDYLCRMRQAGKNYKSYKLQQKSENLIPDYVLATTGHENTEDVDSHLSNEIPNGQSDNTTLDSVKINKDEISLGISSPLKSASEDSGQLQDEIGKNECSEMNSTKDETQGLLDYLFLAKLFA